MQSSKNIIRSIDASLLYGQFFSGKWAAFLYAQFFAHIGILITCFIYYLLVKFGIEDGEAVLSMICCSILLGIALAIIGFILLKNFNLKKKILLWLKDAVELTAETIVLDSFKTFGHPFAETKLLVKFVYKRETITRTSEDKTKKDHWYKRNGYFKVLSKYGNKTIKILYSPFYDQVLILKNSWR